MFKINCRSFFKVSIEFLFEGQSDKDVVVSLWFEFPRYQHT